ncbi:hypothetical protein FQA39_LY15952 [Lamprigera yunnana]|nr:hypothetical protein FQA39_LY15952 [Lamprigera yunnana]
MKNILVYALSFIFSTVFGFNPLLLLEEDNGAIRHCVSHFVLREFTENLPIYHVHDGSAPVIMPYVGNNPYVIIDINRPIKEAEHYASYYIFQTANPRSFYKMYQKMIRYKIWNDLDLREKKCLIIASNSEKIVHRLNRTATYIAVNNYTNKIYTFDRYHKGNQCGTKCNILTQHQCNTNKNYFKTTGSLQNCSVDFWPHDDSNYDILNAVLKLIFEEFTNYLGFSLNIFQCNSKNQKPTGDFQAVITKLAQLLTVDQYDKSFENLKDLADSEVPVCIYKEYLNFISKPIKEDLVYLKIKERLIAIENGTDVLNYRNCTYLMTVEEIVALKYNTKYRFNYFINDGLYNEKVSPYLERGGHLTKILNRVVQRFDENGITEHIISKANKKRNDYYKRIDEEESEPKVLTMEHVYGIFVIWAVGIALSVIVFLVEIASQIVC